MRAQFPERHRVGVAGGLIIVIGLILIVAGLITAVTLSMGDRSAAADVGPTTPIASATPSDTTPISRNNNLSLGELTATTADGARRAAEIAASGTTPAPWQYDAVTNQHWHPGHSHWHSGPPPANPDDAPGVGTPFTLQPGSNTLTPTPQPWEYDATTNRFWHPQHNHWHNGTPPPLDQRGG